MRKLLAVSLIGLFTASCGGGGGGSTGSTGSNSGSGSNSNTGSNTTSNSTPSINTSDIKTINGTVVDDSRAVSGLLSKVSYISAVKWEKEMGVNVPVGEMAVKVSNGTFSLPVESGKYALFLFDGNGTPVGYVGANNDPFTFDVNADKNVTVYLQNSNGVIEAGIDGMNGVADGTFTGDDDKDGIPNAVDPDWLLRFFKPKFLPALYLNKNGILNDGIASDNNYGNDSFSYYYFYFDDSFNDNAYTVGIASDGNIINPQLVPTPAECDVKNPDGTYTEYLRATDENATIDNDYYLNIPYRTYHKIYLDEPVFINPKGLTFVDTLKFKNTVKTALSDWNSAVQQGYGSNNVGFFYLGVWPKGLPYAPCVSFEKGSLSNTSGEIAGSMWSVYDPFKLNIDTGNGTKVMKYATMAEAEYSKAVMNNVNDVHTAEALLGYKLGLNKPAGSQLCGHTSVMDGSSEKVSDFDKKVISDVYSKLKGYSIDFTEIKDYYIDYVKNNNVNIYSSR